MIRIDEIYYNIFLPVVKKLPFHSIHWFDPFGSTNFNDICSQPVVSSALQNRFQLTSNHACRRILFWDQEPLHKELIDITLPEFIKKFNTGKIYIVSSERDSENVEYVCNNYDVGALYYFFHGWAALDWYRGYNRTFLIAPPEQRNPTKTFIAPNRIIAGKRQHRLEMLYWIFKLGLTDNHISCPTICPAENVSIYDSVKVLPFDDAEQVFQNATLPMQFKNETDHPMHSCWLSLFDESADSLLYLVTETVADGRRHHLTEKTFKPIALGMPFVLAATTGSLEYLRSYGFKTFGHLWDESYDTIEDPHERIKAVASLLSRLHDLSAKERNEIHRAAIPTIEHNYNHFYNGGFEKILWDELQGMLDHVKSGL